MKFRHDINGLRAIAVIAVVLFHFNTPLLSGGFAGVDVFFAISGFLMTSIIIRGINNNNFSILSFYKARAIRIVPALLVMSVTVLLLCYFILIPLKFEQLGRHVMGSLNFMSNITYWKESGYFDTSSQTKWLLHTWSLSVEWQFYLLYPILLVLLKKIFSLNVIKKILVIMTMLGFIFSIYASYYWPSPAYYLFPTRAWEMMMGGLVFIYPINIQASKKKYVEYSGLFFIIVSYFFISKTDMWPGYLAFIPVFGAALVILAANQDSIITSNKYIQKIGLWSYSIYLWHWPIVVLGRYLDIQYWAVIGIPSSVLLGFLSYTLIEKKRFELKTIFIPYLFVLLLSYIVLSHVNIFYNIPKSIFKAVVTNTKTDHNGAYTWSRIRKLNKKIDFITHTKNKVLVIGDSQAGDFLNAFYDAKLTKNVEIVTRVVEADCGFFYLTLNEQESAYLQSPTIKNSTMWQNKCKKFIKHVDDGNALKDANVIILAMYWQNVNMDWIFKSIENIRKKNPNAEIYVVGGKSFDTQVSTLVYNAYRKKIDIGSYAAKNIASNNKENRVFQNKLFESKSVLAKYNYHFINMTKIMCHNDKCDVIDSDNNIFYSDRRHTTRAGTKYIGMQLNKMHVFPNTIVKPM